MTNDTTTPGAGEGLKPRTHRLKTWPQYFRAVKRGEKRFEVRRNDRDFRVGDRLELVEFDPEPGFGFTGEEHHVDVAYVLLGPGFGLDAETVVMSIDPAPADEQLKAVRALIVQIINETHALPPGQSHRCIQESAERIFATMLADVRATASPTPDTAPGENGDKS